MKKHAHELSFPVMQRSIPIHVVNIQTGRKSKVYSATICSQIGMKMNSTSSCLICFTQQAGHYKQQEHQAGPEGEMSCKGKGKQDTLVVS
jgi:hypothetical protein